MQIQIDYTNHNVVVIGGTSGINLGIAQTFAKHGANVAVVSRSQDKVDAAVASLQSKGSGQMLGFSADVRDITAIEQCFASIADSYGEIHVLISGAAGNFPANAVDMSANAFKSVVDIDLLGTYHVMRSAHPYLDHGASVINISAPQAYIALHAQSHVCAAKAGVDMITKCLALEWGEKGIRVNSIVPGPIDNTEGMKRLAPNEQARALVNHSVPLKRMGETDDIAHTALFLASDLASYVSGTVIPVDGGWSVSGLGGMSHAMEAFAKGAPKR